MTLEELKEYVRGAAGENRFISPRWLLSILEGLESAPPCPHFITPQGQKKCIQCASK